jgi:sulfur-carrier protein
MACATHSFPRSADVAHVTFINQLRQHTGGVPSIDVEAKSIQQLLRMLSERFPELAPHLDAGVAIAIDGQIYQDALFQQIGPDSDVHLLPMIAGG